MRPDFNAVKKNSVTILLAATAVATAVNIAKNLNKKELKSDFRNEINKLKSNPTLVPIDTIYNKDGSIREIEQDTTYVMSAQDFKNLENTLDLD